MASAYTKATEDQLAAKQKYDACANSIPQDKACMDAADKDFKAAQAKLKDLKNQQDQLVDKVTDIIVKAVKKLGDEGALNKPAKQTVYNVDKVDIDAKSSPRNTTDIDETNMIIFTEEESQAADSETNGTALTTYKKSFDKFLYSGADVELQNLSTTLFSQFSIQDRLKLIGSSLKDNTNGKSLIYSISDKLSKNESETSIIDFTKIELKKFLTTILTK